MSGGRRKKQGSSRTTSSNRNIQRNTEGRGKRYNGYGKKYNKKKKRGRYGNGYDNDDVPNHVIRNGGGGWGGEGGSGSGSGRYSNGYSSSTSSSDMENILPHHYGNFILGDSEYGTHRTEERTRKKFLEFGDTAAKLTKGKYNTKRFSMATDDSKKNGHIVKITGRVYNHADYPMFLRIKAKNHDDKDVYYGNIDTEDPEKPAALLLPPNYSMPPTHSYVHEDDFEPNDKLNEYINAGVSSAEDFVKNVEYHDVPYSKNKTRKVATVRKSPGKETVLHEKVMQGIFKNKNMFGDSEVRVSKNGDFAIVGKGKNIEVLSKQVHNQLFQQSKNYVDLSTLEASLVPTTSMDGQAIDHSEAHRMYSMSSKEDTTPVAVELMITAAQSVLRDDIDHEGLE